MRATPVLLLVAAVLAAGCASDSTEDGPDLGPLADQADRVAELIDEQRPCEALEATRTLASLTDDERFSDPVNEAVVSFASSAEASIECGPQTSDPASDPASPDADDGEEDGDELGDRDDEKEKKKEQKDDGEDGDGEDGDGADGNGEDGNGEDGEHPGEGKARGKNGNPGRGNDDD